MIKNEYSELFASLQKEVFEGNILAIDGWFQSHFDKFNIKEKLINYIFNESHFFSYRSTLYGSSAIMKEEMKYQEFKRHQAILKHFSLPEQLMLFSSQAMHDRLTPEHFKLLQYNFKDRDLILKDSGISYLITTLFHKEKFSEIEKIEEILKLNLLENKSKYFCVCRKDGAFYIQSKIVFLAPIDDIIVNFTPNKKSYIESRGIELKNIEAAKEVKQHILDYIEASDYLRHLPYRDDVNSKTQLYVKDRLYDTLQNNLDKKAIIKSRKI